MTINGSICFSRYVLRPKTKADSIRLLRTDNATAVVPLDQHLGLNGLPFKMTAAVMLEAAYWAQNQCSYQAAEDALFKTLGIKINDDTVRLVTNTIGALVFQQDCENARSAYEMFTAGKLSFPYKKTGTIYIETDGAALNTRHMDQDGSTWRENKLGLVFSSDNLYSWHDKHGELQHKIQKKEYVSYVGSVDEFQKHLFACALRNGYGNYTNTVLLSDGATWIRNMKELLFPDAQQILDYFHLCENVYAFAKDVFNQDESLFKPWAARICTDLKKSRYRDVLQELERMDTKKLNKSAVNLHGYISNNINNIDYATYLDKGYFIGSGAIESANKTILQKRLKQAGMRWNVSSAQSLLTLRAKRESGLWLTDVVIPVSKQYGANSICHSSIT